MIKEMYDDYVRDTESFRECCTRSDGSFPDPEDQRHYEARVATQRGVAEWLLEHRL